MPKYRFEALIKAIAKLCLYVAIGNEELTLLPKIMGKIESGTTPSYLIVNDIVLSQTKAIDWIQSHRLDASIVHKSNGDVYLRSRPHHSFWDRSIYYDEEPEAINFLPSEKPVETIVRSVGKKKEGQCVWGFINGISNTKAKAASSAEFISSTAGGEEVLYLPNDSILIDDLSHCLILKAEHTLKLLNPSERGKLRIFTLGGGSFISPGAGHPDSHNYVSAADAICRLSSPRLQILALFRYEGMKNGLTQKKMIEQLAMRDALLHLDSVNKETIKAYAKTRVTHYAQEFLKISNVTVLDPDTVSFAGHAFNGPCYQTAVDNIIKKYQHRTLK